VYLAAGFFTCNLCVHASGYATLMSISAYFWLTRVIESLDDPKSGNIKVVRSVRLNSTSKLAIDIDAKFLVIIWSIVAIIAIEHNR
jgi:hypothetical protein